MVSAWGGLGVGGVLAQADVGVLAQADAGVRGVAGAGGPAAAAGGGAVEGAAGGTGGTAGGAPPAAPGMSPMFTFVLFGFLILMIMTTVLSGRKEKKRRAALMSSLAKLDRVQTSAGIIGTITELKDDEVVLRVDEASNTRIRFSRAAIASVLERGPRSGSSSETAAAAG